MKDFDTGEKYKEWVENLWRTISLYDTLETVSAIEPSWNEDFVYIRVRKDKDSDWFGQEEL